jgi:hypothetical protein
MSQHAGFYEIITGSQVTVDESSAQKDFSFIPAVQHRDREPGRPERAQAAEVESLD